MRNLAQFWGFVRFFFCCPDMTNSACLCRLYWEQGGEGVQVVYVDVLLVVNFFMTLSAVAADGSADQAASSNRSIVHSRDAGGGV